MYNKISFKWYDGGLEEDISLVRYFPEGIRSEFQGIMKLIVKLTYEYNMYFQLAETNEDILIIDYDYANSKGFKLKGFIHDIKFIDKVE